MRPALVRPEIRRGEPWDPWQGGPSPRLPVAQLRPFIDVIRVEAPDGYTPFDALYLGHAAGKAALGVPSPGRGIRVAMVPAELLGETPRPPADVEWSQERFDFCDGYSTGAWEALSERPIGTKRKDGTPTWFGRGVAAGHRDRLSGAALAPLADMQAFVAALRFVSIFYPAEYPRNDFGNEVRT